MSSKIPKFFGISRYEIDRRVNEILSVSYSTPVYTLEQKLKRSRNPELRFIESLIEEGSPSTVIYFQEPYNERSDIEKIKERLLRVYVLERAISRVKRAYKKIPSI